MTCDRSGQRILAAAFLIVFAGSAWAFDYDSRSTEQRVDPGLASAQDAIAREDWQQAASLLDDYTRVNPYNADGFNLLGYSYRKMKRYDEALANYQKALDLDPEHLGANEYLGMLYVETGQLDKARERPEVGRENCGSFEACKPFEELEAAIERAVAHSDKD